jgi:hypothetical protein
MKTRSSPASAHKIATCFGEKGSNRPISLENVLNHGFAADSVVYNAVSTLGTPALTSYGQMFNSGLLLIGIFWIAGGIFSFCNGFLNWDIFGKWRGTASLDAVIGRKWSSRLDMLLGVVLVLAGIWAVIFAFGR